MRILAACLVFLLLVGGFVYAVSHAQELARVDAETPAVAAVVVAQTDVFDETGTIDYTENSTGEETPYLVYKSSRGGTMTKALVFADSSDCVTSSGSYPCPLITDALRTYFGAGPVHITGTVNAEHVVVSQMKLV